jgi:hypothetical protein
MASKIIFQQFKKIKKFWKYSIIKTFKMFKKKIIILIKNINLKFFHGIKWFKILKLRLLNMFKKLFKNRETLKIFKNKKFWNFLTIKIYIRSPYF